MVLPAGSSIPPLPALLVLVAATAVVAVLVRRRDPVFSPRVVLAFVPWMVAGAALHVSHRLAVAPDAIDPFLGTPAVYVSTFVVAAATWLAADRTDRAPLVLAARAPARSPRGALIVAVPAGSRACTATSS